MNKNFLLLVHLFLFNYLGALETELNHLRTSLQQLHTALSTPLTTLATIPFKFTLTTCNMLYEPFYVQYLKKNNVLIDIQNRRAAFRKSLQNNHALQNVDILCFQEWPYGVGELRQNKNDVIYINKQAITKNNYFNSINASYLKFIEDLADAYPTQAYEYIYDNLAPYDTVLTVINKNKFQLLSSQTITLDISKRILVTIIQPKNHPHTMGVINAHLPYNAQANLHGLNTIKKIIADNSSVTYWIVCGDFNYDILDLQYHYYLDQTLFNQLANRFPHFNNVVLLLGQQEKSGYYLPATAWGAHNYPEHDDYVFFSNTMKVLNASLFPTAGQLIHHENQDPNENDYFSDHAVIRIEFQL